MKKGAERESKWARNVRYFRSIPIRRQFVLYLGVFCLFSSVGVLLNLINGTWRNLPWTVAFALISGAFAILWAYAGFNRVIWLMIAAFPAQFLINWALTVYMERHSTPMGEFTRAAVQSRLRIEGAVAMLFVIGGYVAIVQFIRGEGARMFSHMTEVRLAQEVHQTLVPEIARTVGGYELYGASVPSGDVGGDLVDVVEDSGQWLAYLADVSGHGVSAGMVMAMVKSAVRMGTRERMPLGAFLGNLNRVLKSVSAPNVFVTFAGLAGDGSGELHFALAGHLPILHYRKGVALVEEHAVSNLPLAVLPDSLFATATIHCEPGDVLVLLTDGFTEASNTKGEELGFEPLKALLVRLAGAPLPELMRAMRELALQHGKQNDDQTALLVRRNA